MLSRVWRAAVILRSGQASPTEPAKKRRRAADAGGEFHDDGASWTVTTGVIDRPPVFIAHLLSVTSCLCHHRLIINSLHTAAVICIPLLGNRLRAACSVHRLPASTPVYSFWSIVHFVISNLSVFIFPIIFSFAVWRGKVSWRSVQKRPRKLVGKRHAQIIIMIAFLLLREGNYKFANC